MSTCSVVTNGVRCADEAHARGWCQAHYRRWQTTGDVQASKPLAKRRGASRWMDPKDRFLLYVTPRGKDECWPWEGKPDAKGYGVFKLDGQTHRAHKAGYILFIGPWPDDMPVARHTCDNPICANPNHCLPGTQKQNIADMVSRGRHRGQLRTHCPRGHALEGDNLLATKLRKGKRECRICHNMRQRGEI